MIESLLHDRQNTYFILFFRPLGELPFPILSKNLDPSHQNPATPLTVTPIYSVSQKISPAVFWHFPRTVGNF